MAFHGDAHPAALRDALARCSRGDGEVVVLSGPVGSGRTRIMHEACEEARATGAIVLAATGSAMERGYPLSVIHQLMSAAPLPADAAARIGELIEEGALAAAAYSARLTAPVVQGLCAAVLRMAESAPVVLAIDDAQDIDPQSFECLLFLARRTRTARVLILFAQREFTAPPHLLTDAELVRLPHYRRVALAPYPVGRVAELVAERLGAANAHRLAADWYAVSGGNPLLVNALIEDYESGAREWSGCATAGVVIGDGFRRAFINCLYRLDPSVLRAAQALAMVGEPASPQLLSGLLDLEPDAADRALAALERAGLVDRGRFRHPEARAEVIRDMDPAVRADLHRRAAYLLHGSDVEATRVARHIAAAGHVDAPWAAPILRAAAQQAIAVGNSDSAVQWLRLAHRAGADERDRALAKTALMQIEMQLDPASAARHVPWIVEALREGHLDGRLGLAAAKYAFWHGRVDEAVGALGHLQREGDGRLRSLGLWLSHWYPGVRGVIPAAGPTGEPACAAPDADADDGPAGLSVLSAFLRDHDEAAALAGAEQVLRECRSDEGDDALESLTGALTALLYADRADQAARWCEPLLERTTGECGAMWRAQLTAIRAQTALRLGALGMAAAGARSSLSQIPVEGWGVAVGIPLSVLVNAMVALGRLEHAARYLAIPVPEAMFQTPAGVHYLYARGHYRLASGSPEEALDDFRGCADFLRRHGFDLPGLAPWRLGAAEAYLRLGRAAQAADLIEEQLALAGDAPRRTHGAGLRLLAATRPVQQRPELLERAAEILHACGDEYELALTLADLAETWQQLGESVRARAIERRALHLKELCGEAAVETIALEPAAVGESAVARRRVPERALSLVPAPITANREPDAASVDLSDAERRVAELAARGLTNRQISAKLYITVSTVEQHLTRIYRKLGVSRKVDLPVALRPPRADRRSA